jgi:pimeloyl-ACP methyl ester carboxylesterase
VREASLIPAIAEEETMVAAVTVSENSTIVRTEAEPRRASRRARRPFALTAARAGLRLLAPTAPSLAAAYAEQLFLTPPRHRRPAWEKALLESAEAFQIPHDGSFLPAWRWGSGASTVLLVHGWQSRGSQLGAFVAPLLERGLSVVAFDAPGHGDAPSRQASLVTHSRAVASVGAYLGRLHGIIGHSVGGAASLYATRLGLRVERLALVSPPVNPDRFAAGFVRLFGVPDDVHHAMLRRLESRYGVRLEDLDVRRDAERATTPILVVHDADDRVVPFTDGATIAELAPAGRLVTTHGLGHNRILKAPEVLDAIVPFIAEGASNESFAATLDGELYFRHRR